MNRIFIGAAIGAALVYFLDSERGEARRTQFSNWATQYVNGDTVQQARQAGQATIQQAKSLTGQVGDQVNQLRSGRRSGGNSGSSSNSTRSTAGAQL